MFAGKAVHTREQTVNTVNKGVNRRERGMEAAAIRLGEVGAGNDEVPGSSPGPATWKE